MLKHSTGRFLHLFTTLCTINSAQPAAKSMAEISGAALFFNNLFGLWKEIQSCHMHLSYLSIKDFAIIPPHFIDHWGDELAGSLCRAGQISLFDSRAGKCLINPWTLRGALRIYTSAATSLHYISLHALQQHGSVEDEVRLAVGSWLWSKLKYLYKC